MASRTLSVQLRAMVQGYTAPMAQAAASTGQLEASLMRVQRAGAGTAQVGDTLTRRVSLPIALVGAAATKMAVDFDQTFAQMRGLAGVAADEVDGLKEAVLGLAGETGRAPQELAQALYFIRSSGIDGKEALDALEVSAKAAASGLGSTEVVADAVTSAMNAYATSGMTAARATDVLVATAREGKAEPAELAAQMGRLLPVASQLGISFEDVGAAIATLSLNGNDAATSSTQLANVMAKLLKPSEQAAAALDAVGLSTEKVKELIAERGLLGTLEELRARLGESGFVKFLEDQQAVQGGLALLGGDLQATKERFDRLGDSAGASSDAFKQTDSDARTLQKAWAQVQVALIEVGSVIGPVVADIASLAAGFADLPSPVQNAVVYLGLFLAALGPLMSVGGRVVTGLTAMYTALANLAVPANATAGAFNGTAAATSRFAGSLATLGKAGAVVGILFAVREVLGTIADDVDRADLSTLENQLLDLAETGKASGATLTRVFDGIGDSVEGAEQARADLDQLDDALAKLAARDPDAAAEAFKRIKDELRDQGASAGQIKDQFDTYNATLAETDTANRTTGKAVEEATGAIEEQAGATEEAVSALQEYADALKAQFDPMFAAVAATRDLAEANVSVTEAEAALADAISAHGADSLEAMAAQDALTRAYGDAAKAAYDQEIALAGLVDMVRQQPGAVDAAKAKLQEWVDQGFITQATADATAAKFDEVTASANNIPVAKNTHVTVSGVEQSINDIRAIQDRINGLHGRDVGIRIVGTAVGAVGGGVMRFHEGGVVPGRRGEEVAAILQAGERVLPLDSPPFMTAPGPMFPVPSGGGGAGRGGGSLRMTVRGNGGLFTLIQHGIRTGQLQIVDSAGRRVRVAA